MKVKAIISALMLMACGMASAQTKTYLNVETAPGVYKSFEVNEYLKISWGEKKELPTKGKAKATIGSSEVDVNWVQLWAGGPKFAEFNVGATSTEYGGYYTWGGTYANGQDITWNDDHDTDETQLSGDTDTATKLWGSNWCMPTKDDFDNLLVECDVENVYYPNDNTKLLGIKFTGKGVYSSNSIFLPAANNCISGKVGAQGIGGCYWSSTGGESDKAYLLFFTKAMLKVNATNRNYGCSVRAVLAEK